MKVYIPGTYDNRYVHSYPEGKVFIPLSGRSSDLPQTLSEKKSGDGNNVCHVKMLSAKMFTESGDPIIWDWVHHYEPSVYAIDYSYAWYTHRCAVYCQCSYLTDTPGQLMGYSRYRWIINVYRDVAEDEGKYFQRVGGYHQFGVLVFPDGHIQPESNAVYPRSKDMKLSRLAKTLGDYIAYHMDFPAYMFRDNPGDERLIKIFNDGVRYYLDTFLTYDEPLRDIGSSSSPAKITAKAVVNLPTSSLLSKLRLDEYNLVLEEAYSTKPFAAYHIHALQQSAYLDCMDHVPQMNDNNISNIMDIVSLLKGIIVDHKVNIPDSLSSLWLSYRYTYGTGKSDLENAIRFQKRVADGVLFHQGFACYGSSVDTIDGVDVTCRCRITFRQKELDYLEKISTGLYRYGLSPSFYVIWDMIPYSFIVDWFIPIGDALNAFDKRRMYERTYDMSDIWFSLKYSMRDDDGSYTAYTRWASSSLPEFHGYYSLEDIGTPSHATVGFRILDTLSLLFR
jgi:hypothetical protein